MEVSEIYIPTDSLYQLKGIDKVYKGDLLEEHASPLDGYKKFYKSILENLEYPERARNIGVECRVYLQFVIEPDGSMSNIEVLKGIGSGCDEAAVQALKDSMALWTPAKIRGRVIRSQKMLPVVFRFR